MYHTLYRVTKIHVHCLTDLRKIIYTYPSDWMPTRRVGRYFPTADWWSEHRLIYHFIYATGPLTITKYPDPDSLHHW